MENEFNCKNCANQNSPLCRLCSTVKSPSGRVKRPSLYVDINQFIKEDLSILPPFMRIEIARRKAIKEPPLGIKPREIYESERLDELARAILRYIDSEELIPGDWIEEYNELMKKRQEKIRASK